MSESVKRYKSIYENIEPLPQWFLDNLPNTKNAKYETLRLPGTTNSVRWKSGLWIDGSFINGYWDNGIWKNGTMYNVIWDNGIWENGIWKDGRWADGVWKKGIWKKGIWIEGIWENGVWENGTWLGGVWKNGIWKGGTSWKGGTWKKGLIYDPHKLGNLDPKWKIVKHDYVESPINPSEYFKNLTQDEIKQVYSNEPNRGPSTGNAVHPLMRRF